MGTSRNADDIETAELVRPIKLENYKILQLVGRGGFATVFKAQRLTDRKLFAIKVLSHELSKNATFRERFLREGSVQSQLQHPRIVGFEELGVAEDGALYIVMQYVETVDWNDVVTSLPLQKRIYVAARVIEQCLDALVYAHGKGIVHRDLKPNNILLSKEEGRLKVKLADFGLAKNYLMAGESGLTEDWELSGTASYIAPELLDGYRYFQPVSDQYALAATLYTLLTNRPPLEFPSGANFVSVIRKNAVARIETLVPEISPCLASWIHTGLNASVKNRFSSTELMRDALVKCIARGGL